MPDGSVGRCTPDGNIVRIAHDKLGMIGNGHHVKLSDMPGNRSQDLDFTFEKVFDAADSGFPDVITWAMNLDRSFEPDGQLSRRFRPQSASDEEIRALVESLVSLAVRSPMNRDATSAIADISSVEKSKRYRDMLLGINMSRSQRTVADAIGSSAKFAILFSQSKEFIFGDGFFHNILMAVDPPRFPKIIAPITPTMCAVLYRPMSWMLEPRLSTVVLNDDEVELCNFAVQAYSHSAIFFRSDAPRVHDEFARGERLMFSHPDNPMDELLRSIPGVPPRDRSVDFLLQGTPGR